MDMFEVGVGWVVDKMANALCCTVAAETFVDLYQVLNEPRREGLLERRRGWI